MKKNRVYLFLLVLVMIFVVGCTKNTSSTKTSTSNQVQKTKKSNKPKQTDLLTKIADNSADKIKYTALGDSISVGLFANSSAESFNGLLAQKITNQTKKQVDRKVHAIVGKTATNYGLSQLDAIIAEQPDLITIEFGTNDAVGGVNNSLYQQFIDSMNEIVQTLKEKTKAQIVLVTAWSPKDGTNQENVKAYDQVITKIGSKYHLPVANLESIWLNNSDVVGPYGQMISEFSANGPRDEFHPNQLGHEKIAQEIMSILTTKTGD